MVAQHHFKTLKCDLLVSHQICFRNLCAAHYAAGEFIMSHERVQVPESGKIYSMNEGKYDEWGDEMRAYATSLKKGGAAQDGKPYSARYIGALVADFHRTMLYGGAVQVEFGLPIACKRLWFQAWNLSSEKSGFKVCFQIQLVPLHYGGIYGYPADKAHPDGKLRLLYEVGGCTS